MGQQQLLLVILVTIIVGVATVVAINIFGQSAENANVDALRQDVLTLSAMAQGWYIKPALMGGGGGTFTGVSVYELGFGYDSGPEDEHTATTFTNANGAFTLEGAEDEITITGVSAINGDINVVATVEPNRVVSLVVNGRDGGDGGGG